MNNLDDSSYWWLSFADPELPVGEQFLGVAIVEADNLREAVASAWRDGLNPGGEVGGALISSNRILHLLKGTEGRLLNKEEASQLSEHIDKIMAH